MIENIKRMWGLMLSETQKKAIVKLKENFDLESTVYIKQTWIWGGGIPKKSQYKVVEIFQNLLKEQNQKVEQEIK